MTKKIIKQEQGRSMVEMLGTLAIIGVLSVGSIAGYTYAMNKYYTNELLAGASARAVLVSAQLAMGKKLEELSLQEFAHYPEVGGKFDKTVKEWDGEIGIKVSNVKESVCKNLIKTIQDTDISLASLYGYDLSETDCSGDTNEFYFILKTDIEERNEETACMGSAGECDGDSAMGVCPGNRPSSCHICDSYNDWADLCHGNGSCNNGVCETPPCPDGHVSLGGSCRECREVLSGYDLDNGGLRERDCTYCGGIVEDGRCYPKKVNPCTTDTAAGFCSFDNDMYCEGPRPSSCHACDGTWIDRCNGNGSCNNGVCETPPCPSGQFFDGYSCQNCSEIDGYSGYSMACGDCGGTVIDDTCYIEKVNPNPCAAGSAAGNCPSDDYSNCTGWRPSSCHVCGYNKKWIDRCNGNGSCHNGVCETAPCSSGQYLDQNWGWCNECSYMDGYHITYPSDEVSCEECGGTVTKGVCYL